MHKILVSAGVLVVAGLIGYTTTKNVLNVDNGSQVATPLGSYGDGWLIVPDVGYDPRTGEKYIGVSGSIDLSKLKKNQCFAEEQKVKGLYTQIKQINSQEAKAKTQAEKTSLVKQRARLNDSLRKAEKIMNDCHYRKKLNIPDIKDMPGKEDINTNPVPSSPNTKTSPSSAQYNFIR